MDRIYFWLVKKNECCGYFILSGIFLLCLLCSPTPPLYWILPCDSQPKQVCSTPPTLLALNTSTPLSPPSTPSARNGTSSVHWETIFPWICHRNPRFYFRRNRGSHSAHHTFPTGRHYRLVSWQVTLVVSPTVRWNRSEDSVEITSGQDPTRHWLWGTLCDLWLWIRGTRRNDQGWLPAWAPPYSKWSWSA